MSIEQFPTFNNQAPQAELEKKSLFNQFLDKLKNQDLIDFDEVKRDLTEKLKLNLPEVKTSFNKIWSSIKELDFLPSAEADNVSDQAFEFLDQDIDASTDLGNRTAELLNHLASHGLLAPNKYYQGGYSKTDALESIRGQEKFWQPRKFHSTKHDATDFEASGVYQKSDGQNLIYEKISGNLNETPDVSFNNSLLVYNQKQNKALDLKQLLPDNFSFEPTTILDIETNQNIKNKNKRFAQIQNYQGINKNTDKFYSAHLENKNGIISYGDLSKKGNLLSLLHEIGHAWRTEYQDETQIDKFRDYYKKMKPLLLEQLKQDGHTSGKKEYYQNNKYIGKSVDDGFKINTGLREIGLQDVELIIHSDELKEKFENFVREERDAWADALRALRYLRKQGIDLEPELQTPQDLHDIIHENLGTYQAGLEETLTMGRDIKQFTIDKKLAA